MDVEKTLETIINGKNLTKEDWKKIETEILEFLESDAPKEEKELFHPFGYLEMLYMKMDD